MVAHDYSMGDWYPDEQKTLVVPEKKVGNPGISYIYHWVVPALVAGQVPMVFSAFPSLAAYAKDGRVKLLAANSLKRSAFAGLIQLLQLLLFKVLEMWEFMQH